MKKMLGIIGGSGFYNFEGLENSTSHEVKTPFGSPSGPIITGTLNGLPVAFLARHGQGHGLLPAEVPYGANIYALKSLGVNYIISVSAIGSLRENMAPCDIVIPSQYLDFTKGRKSSFFGEGLIAHVSMAKPTCPNFNTFLGQTVSQVLNEQGSTQKLHQDACYICMEGPQFSTQAESHLYRLMQADVIGMTNMPEAKFAKEAQIAYSSLCMVTDYDCWHPTEEAVTADMAIANLMKNAKLAKEIVKKVAQNLALTEIKSKAHTALQYSLITPKETLPKAKQEILQVLLD